MATPGDIRRLKGHVSRARDLMERGSHLEALEELEHFHEYESRWVVGDGEIQTIRDAARRLAGEIRGRMAEVVLRGPALGRGRGTPIMWHIEVWPKRGPHVVENLALTEAEARELGSRLGELLRRKLLFDFTLDRWTSLPLSEFETRVIERIESGTFE